MGWGGGGGTGLGERGSVSAAHCLGAVGLGRCPLVAKVAGHQSTADPPAVVLLLLLARLLLLPQAFNFAFALRNSDNFIGRKLGITRSNNTAGINAT